MTVETDVADFATRCRRWRRRCRALRRRRRPDEQRRHRPGLRRLRPRRRLGADAAGEPLGGDPRHAGLRAGDDRARAAGARHQHRLEAGDHHAAGQPGLQRLQGRGEGLHRGAGARAAQHRGRADQRPPADPGFVFTGSPAGAHREAAGAWTPEETVAFMLARIEAGDFYILCPDNDVPRELDERRILWAAGDIVENRPALSRWHPDYAEAFAGQAGGRRGGTGRSGCQGGLRLLQEAAHRWVTLQADGEGVGMARPRGRAGLGEVGGGPVGLVLGEPGSPATRSSAARPAAAPRGATASARLTHHRRGGEREQRVVELDDAASRPRRCGSGARAPTGARLRAGSGRCGRGRRRGG